MFPLRQAGCFQLILVPFFVIGMELGELNRSQYWPDFTCVPGWHKITEQDYYLPLGYARATGVLTFETVLRECESDLGIRTPVDIGRMNDSMMTCFKFCILKTLSIYQDRVNGNETGTYELNSSEEIADSLRLILTDPGGTKASEQIASSLVANLRASILYNSKSSTDSQNNICPNIQNADEIFTGVDRALVCTT